MAVLAHHLLNLLLAVLLTPASGGNGTARQGTSEKLEEEGGALRLGLWRWQAGAGACGVALRWGRRAAQEDRALCAELVWGQAEREAEGGTEPHCRAKAPGGAAVVVQQQEVQWRFQEATGALYTGRGAL